MCELTKRISLKISSVLSKVDPEPDLCTGSGSDQKVPAPAPQHWAVWKRDFFLHQTRHIFVDSAPLSRRKKHFSHGCIPSKDGNQKQGWYVWGWIFKAENYTAAMDDKF